MAHNFFTPGKRSLAVIDEMVYDKYPEPLIHEGKNLKKKKWQKWFNSQKIA